MVTRKFLINLFAILSIFVSSNGAIASTVFDQALSTEWVAPNQEYLNSLFKDTDSVGAFFDDLIPLTEPKPKIGEYIVTSLHNDGALQLVVTVSFSRDFYNHIFVVRRSDEDFEYQELFTGGPVINSLESSIVDLKSTGEKQLLIPRELSPYSGATPNPVITDVYAWNGFVYRQSNVRFKEYYRNILLPLVTMRMNELDGKNLNAELTRHLKMNYSKEIDEINKIIRE